MQKIRIASLSWFSLILFSWNYGSQELYSPFYINDVRARIGYFRPFIFAAAIIAAGILASKALVSSIMILENPVDKNLFISLGISSSLSLLFVLGALLLKRTTLLKSCTLQEINRTFFRDKMGYLIVTGWAAGLVGIVMYSLLSPQHHEHKKYLTK
jgi:hypothetical protein